MQSEMHGMKNRLRIRLTRAGPENDTAAGIVCFWIIRTIFHAPDGQNRYNSRILFRILQNFYFLYKRSFFISELIKTIFYKLKILWTIKNDKYDKHS